jgi:hypothetical protein
MLRIEKQAATAEKEPKKKKIIKANLATKLKAVSSIRKITR